MTYIQSQTNPYISKSVPEFKMDSQRNPSDNDKTDIIQTELKQFSIALQIMAKHPDVLSEYKAVLSAAKHSETGTAPEGLTEPCIQRTAR
jgi:hypothetical protein